MQRWLIQNKHKPKLSPFAFHIIYKPVHPSKDADLTGQVDKKVIV